jgi:hypothetical protein
VELKWFIFKLHGRWCTVMHVTKDKAVDYAEKVFQNGPDGWLSWPPYEVDFVSACTKVGRKLDR